MTKMTSINIQHDKHSLLLEPTGLYTYQGFQVLEAQNQDQTDCYYLLFYKTAYLTGKHTIKIKRSSRLSSILQKGITLPPTHPFVSYLLTHNRIHTFPALNPLWEKVQKKYSPLEAANILTIFDTYMKKEKIIKAIKELALKLRRDGQLLHTYQMLRLLSDLYPSHPWAPDMSKSLQYQSYQSLYQSNLATLAVKDPLYAEQYCYEHLEDKTCLTTLHQLMEKEGRIMELLCLYAHSLIHDSPCDDLNYKQLTALITENPGLEGKTDILAHVAQARAVPHDRLWKDLLTLLKNEGRYEDALLLLTKNNSQISTKNFPYLLEILTHLDPSKYVNMLEKLRLPLSDSISPKEAQSFFQVVIPILLKEKGLEYTNEWLMPYYIQYPTVPILLKIKKMAVLKDDPDQMYALGELYYQMKQLNEAVECFNWELELDPTDTRSIKWLTKLYLELGMIEESKSYQYMYHNLQKGS
ncbi:tetratricopeptide (TPR) repeat protein [Bacillus tianshenii]|uniref:Tetratricopeptide (TPR) repeat protein n=1 Tax=Sutcliffiella tianshenii TaxID=1463404 RepID=A0ABS2NVR8_9BACI|nr:tetratricopeptide repeat protein [Bacillus tianshenii]MBM7618753.1 tetratricopeptide (TPR) repeat protein [Bacillus tianshenii]